MTLRNVPPSCSTPAPRSTCRTGHVALRPRVRRQLLRDRPTPPRPVLEVDPGRAAELIAAGLRADGRDRGRATAGAPGGPAHPRLPPRDLHAPAATAPTGAPRPRSTPAGSTARRAAPGRARGWPQLHARGELALDSRSCTSRCSARASPAGWSAETEVGGRPAVVPEITGRAWVTGMGQYLLDPVDPFPAGFARCGAHRRGPARDRRRRRDRRARRRTGSRRRGALGAGRGRAGEVAGGTTGRGEGNVLVSDKPPGAGARAPRAASGLGRARGSGYGERARIRRKGALLVHREARRSPPATEPRGWRGGRRRRDAASCSTRPQPPAPRARRCARLRTRLRCLGDLGDDLRRRRIARSCADKAGIEVRTRGCASRRASGEGVVLDGGRRLAAGAVVRRGRGARPRRCRAAARAAQGPARRLGGAARTHPPQGGRRRLPRRGRVAATPGCRSRP